MSLFSESLRAFLRPVVAFLDDPEVSEILINGPREVWVERRGKLSRTEATFTEEGLLAAARNMAQYVGRPLTEERPRLDARLPDGSRIHVVLPPVARKGTCVSIRKFFPERLKAEHLIGFGTVSRPLARLLEVLVGLRQNLVVSGGTGSGKTSLLNVLSSMIAPDERILTIEDSAELQLQQPHLVSFESRPSDKQGKGEVGIGDLLQSALRLRPDRIVVGEVRGGECFHLLQAMNTGHGGSLTSIHANTPLDALRRLESLCLLSGIELPLRAVRAQVASAVHVVIACERMADGSRKVTHVTEVLPLDERGDYRAQDLFVFVQTGRGPQGEVLGHHAPTGLLPTFFPRLVPAGFGDVDAAFFDPVAQGLPAPALFVADLGPRSQRARATGAELPAPAPPAPPPPVVPVAPAASVVAPPAPPPAASPAAEEPSTPGETTDPHLRQVDPVAAAEAEPARPIPSAGAPLQAHPVQPPPFPPELVERTPPGALARTPTGAAEPSAEAPGAHAASQQAARAERTPSGTLRERPLVQELTPPGGRGPAGKVRAPGAVRATTLAPQPPAQQAAPKRAPATAGTGEPSIQLDPTLQAEVEAALPFESTLITRNPLLEPRGRSDDEDTSPGARHPSRR